MFGVSEAWGPTYPGAVAGFLLLRDVANPSTHPELEERKRGVERELRARYAGTDRAALKEVPPVPAYASYYRRFGKSYHVLGQLESLVLKGKDLPGVAALVEAMFMAEVVDLVLTAGHDADALEWPVTAGIAVGTERYVGMRGAEVAATAGDMVMGDRRGLISTVLGGPDARTRINPATRAVVFAAYGPPGVGEAAMRAHLERIETYVRIIAPQAVRGALEVLG
jgi:DNA/RNA-binding domain of Phe-tRNA-synthetase-like protein